MRVHFNPSSSNTQLGPIPASTTEKKSCPDSCPVKSTCYAKFHFQGSHWKKVEKTGMEWGDFLKKVKRMQRGQLWRHNVSGDLPHNDGVINGQDVFDLVGANKGRKGFTFTHHDHTNEVNLGIIKFANSSGFTINRSFESLGMADAYMTEHNLPAVCIVPSTESRRFFTLSSGRKVIVCPAKIHEDVNCSKCGLCADANRKAIICFPSHGTAKRKLDEMLLGEG